LGLSAGIVQTKVFLEAMVKMSGYQLEFMIPYSGILTAVAIALFVSQLAAIIPARRATGTKILEAIHYE